jgi:hypothetical protein
VPGSLNYGAITPGTDLPQLARQLQRVHDAVIGGSRPPVQPRALVARSWERVLEFGLDPDAANQREARRLEELERRRRESPLSLVVEDLLQITRSVADSSTFLMVICDADGVILWRDGAASVRARADRLGFTEGAVWTEQRVGTNAIGTALAEAAPVQLFSAEHFEQAQHPWYCTASPIHDPRTGDLLGIVDVSGPALTLHPAILALVDTAVRLAELQLWRRHEDGLERLRRAAEHVIATASGPLLLVDDHGWVAQHVGISARGRIAAPREHTAVAVPGLGLCLPERLAEGWLIRPSSTAHSRSMITAELTLQPTPVLSVRGEGEPWRTSLSRRHAEIVGLLHDASPAGLTAAQLSQRLFGDQEHLVTVRAEISRLRRAIGAVVATHPYRLADGVQLTVTGGQPGGR